MGANVVVVGMHRSGTSAIAGSLSLLGFSPGATDDFMPPRPPNPDGNREHRRLSGANEAVLGLYGGSWHTPPRLSAGWERQPKARELVPPLRSRFAETYPVEGWVWKDPRASLTLPLWLGVWESPPIVVLPVRHPIAVARSLEARNGFSVQRSLELWERYNRDALRNARGLRLLVRSYDRVFDDPTRFVRGLLDELTSLGARVDGSVSDAAAALKPSLRRNIAGDRELSLLSAPQLELWQRLQRQAAE